MLRKSKYVAIVIFGAAAIVSGCGGSNNNNSAPGSQSATNPSSKMFTVTVTNLTNNQPLSPIGVVVHEHGYNGWNTGESSSLGLEVLAEGGSPTQFIADADNDQNVTATGSGTAAIFPGLNESITLTTANSTTLELTVATMLVHTNDAFTGVKNRLIGELNANESTYFYTHTYDAGTESNSEIAGSIPGPDFGGEGYNASRDDKDIVSVHAGVITQDDGLVTSGLNETHRFQNTTAKITVTRIN